MAHLILYLSLGTLPSFGKLSSSISILSLPRLQTFLLQIFVNDLDATIFDESDHHSISKHFARLLLPLSSTFAQLSALSTAVTKTARMDEQGWAYNSAIPYMYKLVSAEESWPSTNYDELGLSWRQAEFRRVTRTVIEEFNANPRNHPPTCPNAIGQYLIEVQIWKILWPNESLKKFPRQRPVPPQPKAPENLQKSFRMAYEMAFTSSITEPTPLLATPQTPKPQSQTYQAVDIPSSSSSEKPIPTGPAAMRRHKIPAMNLQPRRPVHKQGRRQPDPYKKRHNQPTPPKPSPQTAHINHQPYKRVLPSNLRAEALKAILNSKGIGYVPKHGFNKFGLPMYTITCFAPDAFLAFTGKEQVYIKKIAEQLPKFRIMYQKTRKGFLVIWFEYKGSAFDLTTSNDDWKEFRKFWAFVKSWADQEGEFFNVVDYMEKYEGDAEAEAEAIHLSRPKYWYH